MLICNPVIIAEFAVQGMFSDLTSTAAQAFAQAFLVAGLCEEGFKFLVLHKFCARKKDFDEPMDGMVYGVVASLGFATLENVLYVLGGGMDVALARAATAVPAHACFGGLMGYFYAKAHFGTRSTGGYMMALAIPIVAHGIYNFPLFMLEAPQVDSEPSLALQILGGFILYVVCLIPSPAAASASRQEQVAGGAAQRLLSTCKRPIERFVLLIGVRAQRLLFQASLMHFVASQEIDLVV